MEEFDPNAITAHHEAAHAVAFHEAGIAVQYISVNGTGWGLCHVEDTPPTFAVVVAKLAGLTAEMRLLTNRSEVLKGRKSGWTSDIEQSHELLSAIGRPSDFEIAQQASARLVGMRWGTITRLACAIVCIAATHAEDGDGFPYATLSGDEIRRVLE